MKKKNQCFYLSAVELFTGNSYPYGIDQACSEDYYNEFVSGCFRTMKWYTCVNKMPFRIFSFVTF